MVPATAAVADSQRAWHSLPLDSLLALNDTARNGLSAETAAARLAAIGPNRLSQRPTTPALRILLDQFTGVVVWLLIGAGAMSASLRDYLEAGAIAAVLVINTAIGFITEWRARRAMEALGRIDVLRATVVRGGRLQVIDAAGVVPGDAIEITAGHGVPADARLIAASDLRVNEAALTGESMPVAKRADSELPAATDLADRDNMVFKGTTAIAGFGRAAVVATGDRTEVGRVGALAGSLTPEQTPLERQLDALGRRLVWATLAIAALVAMLNAAQGAPLALMVETGIALAVAAVPEALPAVATIALAVGMRRMARRSALVRRLPVVETLGSTTVVCTDKTRTLTSGEMAVVRIWAADLEWDPLDLSASSPSPCIQTLRAAALASRPQADAPSTGGWQDPVDAAILEAAGRRGGDAARADDATLVAVIPFSSDRKWMAAFHERGDLCVASIKGAPRAVLDRCTRVLTDRGEISLSDARRHELQSVNEALAAQGLRVIAVGSGSVGHPSEASLNRVAFLGFVGLADPPAAGVRETIARLRSAGLRTVMLTGDQRLTAEAIGQAVGLLARSDSCVDGRVLDQLSGSDLDEVIASAAAFSRVTPEHKLVIVRALQKRGEIVAMLGDGINDAAALKKADVGVAMGIRGTDVAKDAAAIVLQDDRFETIAAAVEEGRIVFDNIRKFVFYLFSCNVAEVLVLLIAPLVSWPSPLAPLQLLWLNLVTDTFPALALAFEPGDPGVMNRAPRDPHEAIMSRRFVTQVIAFALLITLSTLTAFGWGLAYAPDRAGTMAFMTLSLAQIAHLGNARSQGPVLELRRAVANRFALMGVGAAIALQLLGAFVEPLAALLHVTPLDSREWAIVVALALVPAAAGQLYKTVSRTQEQTKP
jgi:Ca2+-transporting ATPase